jgi:predicted PhzF superfamily epimerase YddE/YHI9
MQAVACEMNLSETAFVERVTEGFGLRWFTPRAEVDLCGHATLAAAHILWETGYLGRDDPARFFTKSGTLFAVKRGELIELDFPSVPDDPLPAPPGLSRALGVRPCYTGKNRFDWLVEVATEDEVRRMRPDFSRLAQIPMRGVIVTARASAPGFDFVSRFFAPAVGIHEDPVTGSAHCCLGPFWQKKLGKNALTACQVSERGGALHVRMDTPERVKIAGNSVTVWEGSLKQ